MLPFSQTRLGSGRGEAGLLPGLCTKNIAYLLTNSLFLKVGTHANVLVVALAQYCCTWVRVWKDTLRTSSLRQSVPGSSVAEAVICLPSGVVKPCRAVVHSWNPCLISLIQVDDMEFVHIL